jgi:protein gp37
MTKISWTGKTWNPITGCTKLTAGCKNCYAERMSKRLQAMGQPNYANGFGVVTCHPHMLDVPCKRKKPTMYFVCSMADLFHQDVPDEFIDRVFDVMRACPQHTFQVLTKRPYRMMRYTCENGTPRNVWLGTSVENMNTIHRIDEMADAPAYVRFLSMEPLIGPIDIDVLSLFEGDFNWVIVGGESGPGARPMDLQWALDIRDWCKRAGVPFFFKQRGGRMKGDDWELLDGEKVQEFPVVTQ